MSVRVSAPSRELLVEAVAAIEAAANVLRELVEADHDGAEVFDVIATRLAVDLLDGPAEDEWRWDHPVVVEIEARANEIEADVLEACTDHRSRIQALRARAVQYRAEGSTNFDFWNGEPINAC